MILAVAVFWFSVLLILWTFGGYHLFLMLVSKFKGDMHTCDDKFTPKVSLIIAAFNEERVIKQKIRNSLDLDFPKELLEIIIVDDGSSDATTKFVREMEPMVKLVRQMTRRGKPSAIKSGLQHSSGEVIIITDANSFFDKKVIRKLTRHFIDPSIGGVGGSYEPKVRSNIGIGDKFYWKVEKFLKKRESHVDTINGMNGNIAAIRKSVFSIIELKEDSLVEDFELTVCIRKAGYRVIYEPEAYSWKLAPLSVRDAVMQKKRRSLGIIQTLIRHKDMLFNPKYGFYGVVILPSHRLFVMLAPFFMISSLASGIIVYSWMFYLALMLSICLCLSCLCSKFPKNGLMAIPRYLLMTQLSIVLAWIDCVRRNYCVTWRKSDSTRYLE